MSQVQDWKSEVRVLVQLAWPVIGTNMLGSLLQSEALIYLGHMGQRSLAAATLGNTYFNMLWYFIQGVSTALDTLASQAFGAGDTNMVRVWSMRCAMLLCLLCVPASLLMYYSGSIMLVLFRLSDAQLCVEAGVFVQWSIPGLWFWALYLCVQKYQQTQNIMIPSIVVGALGTGTNVLAMSFFADSLGWGFVGVPLATSVTRFVMLLLLFLHAYFVTARSRSQVAPSSQNVIELKGLRAMLQLGLSGGCMLGLEVWFFEIMTIFAGRLGEIALDAHNILLSACGFVFTSFPLGVSIAATIRVGNLIGAGAGLQAKRAAKISIVSGVSFMAVMAYLMFVFRKDVARIFSNSMPVIQLTAQITPIATLFAVFDGFQGVMGGVLRGLGCQGMIARVNLVCFWALGVPLGYGLCFKYSLGVFGLWWGLFAGIVSIAAFEVFIWLGVDWQSEASRGLLSFKLMTSKDVENSSP